MPRTLHVQNDYVSALRPVLNIAVEGFFAPGFEGEPAHRALTIVPRHLIRWLQQNPRAIFECAEISRFCYSLSRIVDARPLGKELVIDHTWYLPRLRDSINHRAAIWSNEDCLPVHAPPLRPDEMNPFWWMSIPSDPPPPYMVPTPSAASSSSRPVSGSSSITECQMFSVKKPKIFYSKHERDGQVDGVPACRIHSVYLTQRAHNAMARMRYVETDNEEESGRDEEDSDNDE